MEKNLEAVGYFNVIWKNPEQEIHRATVACSGWSSHNTDVGRRFFHLKSLREITLSYMLTKTML